VFPNGTTTTCQVEDLRMTGGEAGNLLRATDFPCKSLKAVADVIVECTAGKFSFLSIPVKK